MRLQRGKMLWISLAIAFLPVLAATGLAQGKSTHKLLPATFGIEMLVLAVLPPLFIASSIGDEIEDRTTTYLWSRPLARWTVLVGKLVALAPFSVAVIVGSWIAAIELSLHVMPPVQTIAGLAAGTFAASMVVTGIATLLPKHGMSMSIIYVLIFDLGVGQIPASIQMGSVTHAAQSIAGLDDATSVTSAVVAITVISAVWIALAFRRIRRLEV